MDVQGAKAKESVKCGEEKPNCSRCTRLGVRCPGYVQSLKWVTEYVQSSPGALSDGQPPSPEPTPSVPREAPAAVGDAPSLDSTNRDAHLQPDDVGFEIDDTNAICDNLWDLPGNRSLPDLTDLCPSSPIPISPSGFSPNKNLPYDLPSSGDMTVDVSHLLSLIGPPQENLANDGSVYPDFSPSRIVRSHLPASQRSTSRNTMSISRPLNNPSWTLIEYYFKEVAALFSSYDSQMNPFRTTVSRLWGSSLAMCRTMQSMAAATLVNDFPQFGPIGRKMRDEAVNIITLEAVMDDKSLLALLMLGQTASWHDPKDLGISFFNLLRKHLNSISDGSSTEPIGVPNSRSNNYRFFEEALVYWEMLLSFVSDNDSTMFSDTSRASLTNETLVLQRVPHPWTGIARDAQFTVHEVGRLVRKERQRIHSRNFTSQDDIRRAQIAIEKAHQLEDRLLNLAHLTEAEIVSTGDDETPIWHLLTVAEVYRCTGLIQLYRVFPDLLRDRLQNPVAAHFPDFSAEAVGDPFFPIDLDCMNLPSGFGEPSDSTTPNKSKPPHQNAHIFPPCSHHHIPRVPESTSQETPPDSLYDTWLTDFAVTLLSRLKTIPFESRTRCLQPLLLVASCSELRLPRLDTRHPRAEFEIHQQDDPTDDQAGSGTETPNISMEAIEVSQTRKFILGRLTSFLHVLPPKPINVCVKLVKEVWRRMDAGEADSYWIDVMIEKGWETTMG
ncbi:transcriptional regulator family: Fungal Specific TF [Penicillium verhagenii]|uniref:transcriptional regulator family: Fungal Specific TF n=1 Tax=Penicillium verhagenii TaxID=1562060 RepID=UPI0025458FD1|nr:transcriptional regulator family: Fungal Specific TF [Penicillium verhagenii]KAJ5924167.1 transcriptional regulator family: Fungal Specific TF [Penicillium verhagenii]